METIIKQTLHTIEAEEQVRILYACESGSRAWGFASHDSDYDVRFLYVRPKAAYLCLDPLRDVIERPIVDNLDINGWDIFKALRLLQKSNPPLLEWLFSPIVYLENSASIKELRAIAQRFYSPATLYYHYSRMADIEECLDKWSRLSFNHRGQVGVSKELEKVLLHIFKEDQQ